MAKRRPTIGKDPLDTVVPQATELSLRRSQPGASADPVVEPARPEPWRDMEAGPVNHPAGEWLTDRLDAGTSGYDPDLAWLLAIVSTWSYASDETLGKVLDMCMGPVRVTSVKAENVAIPVDTQFTFIRSARRPVGILAFRGIEFGAPRFADLLTDPASARQHSTGGSVRLHEGFLRALMSVWHDVLATLDKHRDLKHLLITGHSLGGAVAALAGAVLFGGLDEPLKAGGSPLHQHALDPKGLLLSARRTLSTAFSGVYTYGQPMVGDPAFGRACPRMLRERTYRHVYNEDWVPSMPSTEHGRFEHFGVEIAPIR